MKHPIDPSAPIMRQLRKMRIPEHLPVEQAMVYRFFDKGGRLLYIGVTVSPRGRWQSHKIRTHWWREVVSVSVKFYPHERAALDAEVAAIKSEKPTWNRRSVPALLVRDSCTSHESRTHSSRAILPRVGGGVGGGGELGVGDSFQDQSDNLTVGARVWTWR